MALLTLPELLDALDYSNTEHIQIAHAVPGEQFRTHVTNTTDLTQSTPAGADTWFGINPCTPVSTGRPGADHITRLAALWADLDVKPGACPDFDTARLIVDDLSELLGTRPVAITYSGHGLQPLWAVENATIGPQLPTMAARALLRQWGRLVSAVAGRRDTPKVDSVFDLPRILRTPGTTNMKDPAAPLPVACMADTGAPITVTQILETLNAYGITATPEDRTDPGAAITPPAEWTWATSTCKYAINTTAGWATDNPTGRHPWLISQTVRLACLHRAGCLTEADHNRAADTIINRFRQLLSGSPARKEAPGELFDAFHWGQDRAAALTDTALLAELGGHLHIDKPGERPPKAVPMRPLSLVPPIAGTAALELQPNTVYELATLTDQGNADLLVSRHSDQLRYVPSRAAWLTWAGHRWQWCEDDGEAVQAAVETVQSIQPTDEPLRKHKHASLSRRALEATIGIARRDARMRVTADELDADPHALNTPAGVVNLRTGTLQPADPSTLHTMSTSVGYDPDATCPRWDAFLAYTFEDDRPLADFVQRLAGYSATGEVTHHVLPFLHGSGGNGKSVFLDVMIGILGSYASSTPQGFLMAGAREDESATARLKGMRLVVTSEVNQSAKFDEAKVKLLTGGDYLTARHLYARHFTFKPTHTLWLMGNHQPRVDAGGESFWRRLRLIPFTRTVPKSDRVEGLASKLVAEEGPGILAWIVRGAMLAHTDGLAEPESVLEATSRYAEEEDALARFVTDRCHLGGGKTVKTNTKDVRAAYEQWCREEGEKTTSPQVFGRELRTRFGIESEKSHGHRFYQSMTLVSDQAEPDKDEGWYR